MGSRSAAVLKNRISPIAKDGKFWYDCNVASEGIGASPSGEAFGRSDTGRRVIVKRGWSDDARSGRSGYRQ